MSDNLLTVTDDGFENEVLKASKPVLVDFWADWCGPCKMIAPVLEELAKTYQDKLIIAKVDVDKNPDTPAKYAVRGIPTLILFKGGEVAGSKVGAQTKSELESFINENL